MIKTLIADDEKHAINRLKDLLSDHDQFEIIAEAASGTESLEKMVALKPDVVILDINMPGVSVFKTISSLQDPPIVIFQTAHSKYAADAFDINALDYLMKPVSRERFSQAISKVLDKIATTAKQIENSEIPESHQIEKISIRVQGAIKIIQVSDIHNICFEDGLCFIYTDEGRFITDRSLNYYEEKFSDNHFFRSNRANLVNLQFITTIHKAFKGAYLIELIDGSQVELSRRKALILKKTLDF